MATAKKSRPSRKSPRSGRERMPVQKVLAISRDDYEKLTPKQRERYNNPNAAGHRCEFINGELHRHSPYDIVLNPISKAVGKTILHDMHEPNELPIEIDTLVDGKHKTILRQRTDYECGTAHFGLCLPDEVYFDCRHNAFENAAKALEGVAKLLTDAAARVRKAGAVKGGAA